MSSQKATTINKTAFSIKSAEETFTRAALYESFRKSEILHHVYLENVPTPVLREILNFEHSFIFRQLPVLGSKLAVKFGLEFLVSRFPRLQNYIQPSVLPIRLEDDERLALLEMIRAKPKPNLYVIVAKNISLNVLGISISNIRDAITHSNLSSNELIDMFQLNKTNATDNAELNKDSATATDIVETDISNIRKVKSISSGASESENEELMSPPAKRSAGDSAVTDNDDNIETQQPIHTPPTVYSDLFSLSWQTPTPPLQRQSRSRSRSLTPIQADMPRDRATSTTPVRLHRTTDKLINEQQLQRHQSMLPPSSQNGGSLTQLQRNSVERDHYQYHQTGQFIQQRKAHKRHRYDSDSSNGSRRPRSISSSSSSSIQSSREPTPINNVPAMSSFQLPNYHSQQHSRQTTQSPQWSDANSGDDDNDYASRKQMKPPFPKKQKSIEILNVEVIPAPSVNNQSRHSLSPGTRPSTLLSEALPSTIPKTQPLSKQSVNISAAALQVASNHEKQQQQQKITIHNAHANKTVQNYDKLSDIITATNAKNVSYDENVIVSDNADVDNFNNNKDMYADDIISGDEIKLATNANEKQQEIHKTASSATNKSEAVVKDDKLNDFNSDYEDGDEVDDVDDDDDVIVVANDSSKPNSDASINRNYDAASIDLINAVDDDDDDFTFDDVPKQTQINGMTVVNGNKRHSPSKINDSDSDVKRLKVDKMTSVDTIQTATFRNGSRLNGSNVTYNDIMNAVNGLKNNNKTSNVNGFTNTSKHTGVSNEEYDDIDDFDNDDDLEIIENDVFNAIHKKDDSLKKSNSAAEKWNDSSDNVNGRLPNEIVKVDTVNFDDNYDDDDDELVYE